MTDTRFLLQSLCYGLLVGGLNGYHKDPSDVVGVHVNALNRQPDGLIMLPIRVAARADDSHHTDVYEIEVELLPLDVATRD